MFQILRRHEALPQVCEEERLLNVVLCAIDAEEVEVGSNVGWDVVHHEDALAPNGGREGDAAGVGARDTGPGACEAKGELGLEDGEDEVEG